MEPPQTPALVSAPAPLLDPILESLSRQAAVFQNHVGARAALVPQVGRGGTCSLAALLGRRMMIKASRCAFPQPKRHLLLRSRSCAPPRAAKEAKSSEGLKNFAANRRRWEWDATGAVRREHLGERTWSRKERVAKSGTLFYNTRLIDVVCVHGGTHGGECSFP